MASVRVVTVLTWLGCRPPLEKLDGAWGCRKFRYPEGVGASARTCHCITVRRGCSAVETDLRAVPTGKVEYRRYAYSRATGSDRLTTTTWRYSADSHVGQVRTQNEDSFGADSPPGLFIVADGMGGHAAGEVASQLAVRCTAEGVALLPRPSPVNVARERIQRAIADANQVILIEGQTHPERAGMGTTTTALLLSEEGWWVVGQVGDSRAYLVRDGSVKRITEDHTYVQELVNQGRLSDEEARLHPRSSLLTRALGTNPHVQVDLFDGSTQPGDRFVLASDGLMSMLPETHIHEMLSGSVSAETLVGQLIEAANEAGGYDNVTVIVVEASSADPAPAPQETG